MIVVKNCICKLDICEAYLISKVKISRFVNKNELKLCYKYRKHFYFEKKFRQQEGVCVFRAELSRNLMKTRYLSSRKMMISTYEEHIRLTGA